MNQEFHAIEKKHRVKNNVLRYVLIVLSLLVEVAFLFAMIIFFSTTWEWLSILERVAGMVLVVGIYSMNKTSAMKVPWIILILVVPLVGLVLFFMNGLAGSTRRMRRRYAEVDQKIFPHLPPQEETLAKLRGENAHIGNISRLLAAKAKFPPYEDEGIRYYSDTVQALEEMKADLRAAKKFIFLEYFAIEDAETWQSVQAILEERAAAGVLVRIFYDETGSFSFISDEFRQRMKEKGFHCRIFNPVSPFFRFFLNNRDHRKIMVIDGAVAYTGGFNLANEYFNINSPFGEWKDAGVRVTGNAVKSFTAMFLEMWNAVRNPDREDGDLAYYFNADTAGTAARGFVQPYADSPIDQVRIGEDVYLSLVECAKDYIWFMTPYLILTDEMSRALTLAAMRGVDVRIITPHIPDKKLVFNLTRSYYRTLVLAGVRIYEFTPGFCHAKVCLADDVVGTCGTINLDYRSLYHHFEDGVLFYDVPILGDIKEDFEKTIARSQEVTEEYRYVKKRLRLQQLILRLIAPLL